MCIMLGKLLELTFNILLFFRPGEKLLTIVGRKKKKKKDILNNHINHLPFE